MVLLYLSCKLNNKFTVNLFKNLLLIIIRTTLRVLISAGTNFHELLYV